MASHSKQAYVEDASDSEGERRTQANVAAKRTSYSSDLRGKAHESRPASSSSSPPPPASSSSAASSSSSSSSPLSSSSSSRQASHPSERPREPRIDSGYSSRNSATEDSADSEQSTKSEKTALPPKPEAEVKKSKRPMKVELKQEKAESSHRGSPTKPSRTDSVREKRPKDKESSARREKTEKTEKIETRSRSDRPDRKEKEREKERDRGKEREKGRDRERDPERERERQERRREREREKEREREQHEREQERDRDRDRDRDRARERSDRPDRQARGRAPSVRGDRERVDYPMPPQNYAPPSPNQQRRVQYAQPPHQPQPDPEYATRRPRASSISRPRPESWYGQQLDPYALGMPAYPPAGPQPGPPPSKSAFVSMSMQQPFPYGGTTPPNQGFLQPHVHASPVSPYDPIRPALTTRKTDGEALSARRPSSMYGASTATVISYPDSSIADRQPQLSMRPTMSEPPVNDIGPSARYTSGSAATNPLLLADQPYNAQDDEDDDEEDDYSSEEEDSVYYDEHNYMIASAVLGEGEYDRRAMPPPPRPGLRPHQPRSHTANEVFDLHRSGQLVPIDTQSRSSRSNSNSNPNISRRGSVSSGRKANNYPVASNTGATRIITVESNARPRRRMSYAAREQRAREAERIPREYREYRDAQGHYHDRDLVERDTDSYAIRDRDRDQRRVRAHTTTTPSEVDYRTRNKLSTADAYQRAANEQAGNPMPLTVENIKRRSVNVHLPSVALGSESGSAQTSRSSNSRGKTAAISPVNLLPSNTSALGALGGLEGIKMQIRPDGITLISGHENRTVELKHGEDGHAMLTLGDLQDELLGATSRLGFDDARSRYTTSRR